MAAPLGLSQFVRHVPSLPHAACLARLYEADVLLVVQPDTATQVPGKLYEYLYVGKPILAMATEGATARIVREAELGAVVNSGDVDGIAEALIALYRRARSGETAVPSAARDVLLARHDARALTQELDQVLRGCVSASRARGDRGG
jgi:glycosyltransferase involved in cell wall biosynthesis